MPRLPHPAEAYSRVRNQPYESPESLAIASNPSILHEGYQRAFSHGFDKSRAFVRGVSDDVPKATINFDKVHGVGHASQAVGEMCRLEKRKGGALKSVA